MIQAIIKKGTSSAILTRYTSILNSLTGSFITNISTDKITDLVKCNLIVCQVGISLLLV